MQLPATIVALSAEDVVPLAGPGDLEFPAVQDCLACLVYPEWSVQSACSDEWGSSAYLDRLGLLAYLDQQIVLVYHH